MTNLAEFLLARIAEDEAVARAAVERDGAAWSTEELSDGTRITGVTEFGNPRSYRGDNELWDDEGAMGMWAETAAHIARWDPARVLAECEAKRRIMEALDYTPCPCQRADRCVIHDASAGPPEFARERFVDPATEAVLHALALPYAEHPDYREEWRP